MIDANAVIVILAVHLLRFLFSEVNVTVANAFIIYGSVVP